MLTLLWVLTTIFLLLTGFWIHQFFSADKFSLEWFLDLALVALNVDNLHKYTRLLIGEITE